MSSLPKRLGRRLGQLACLGAAHASAVQRGPKVTEAWRLLSYLASSSSCAASRAATAVAASADRPDAVAFRSRAAHADILSHRRWRRKIRVGAHQVAGWWPPRSAAAPCQAPRRAPRGRRHVQRPLPAAPPAPQRWVSGSRASLSSAAVRWRVWQASSVSEVCAIDRRRPSWCSRQHGACVSFGAWARRVRRSTGRPHPNCARGSWTGRGRRAFSAGP